MFFGSSAGFRGFSTTFFANNPRIYWIVFMTPAYTTIRQWLLIGLYKLNRPKYSPSGWFFVLLTRVFKWGLKSA